jgi:hypothetical protein
MRLALSAVICGLALAGSQTPATAQFDIVGTVTGPTAAVDSVEIRLFTDTGIPVGIPLILTDASGQYVIPGLPSGGYVVQFRPPTADRLLAVELPAVISGASATRNASLQGGHLLDGFVRDGVGAPIPGIDLQVFDRNTGEPVLTPGDDTDATGYYDVIVPTGEFDLEWRSVGSGALPWIPVTDRQVIESDTRVDVVMLLGVFVSGIVTDGFGSPVGGVNLDFIDSTTGVKADTPGDNTFPDGTFIAHVPLGTWDVVAKPNPATRLLAGFLPAVQVAGDRAGVDFVLAAGHLMSGTVSAGGVPVEGVDLDVVDSATDLDVIVPFDVTGPDGTYAVVVPSGVLDVGFTPPLATVLAPQLIPGVVAAADIVLDVALIPGMVFSGTVTAGGIPVPGTDIDLKDLVTGLDLPLTGDGTDAAGIFSTVVPPGNYVLEVEPPAVAGLVALRDSALVISGNLDLPINLIPGLVVTGTARTTSGFPLADVNVDVWTEPAGPEIFTPRDHTDAQGQYRIVVPAGTYEFQFKLGLTYAVRDSIALPGQVVTVDSVVDGIFPGLVSATGGSTPIPQATLAVWPNPFNPSTRVSYEMTSPGQVRVEVIDLMGRRIVVLEDGERPAGPMHLTWDGQDGNGRGVSSGAYLVVVTTRAGVAVAKALLVK